VRAECQAAEAWRTSSPQPDIRTATKRQGGDALPFCRVASPKRAAMTRPSRLPRDTEGDDVDCNKAPGLAVLHLLQGPRNCSTSARATIAITECVTAGNQVSQPRSTGTKLTSPSLARDSFAGLRHLQTGLVAQALTSCRRTSRSPSLRIRDGGACERTLLAASPAVPPDSLGAYCLLPDVQTRVQATTGTNSPSRSEPS